MLKQVDCLDKGYVRLVTWLPQDMAELYEAIQGELPTRSLRFLLNREDLAGVNAAKASFAKSSNALGAGERRLIDFLAKEGHTSPFRHTMVTLEVKAPMMVARQWFKYRVGSEHAGDSSEMLGFDFGQGDDGGFGDVLYARNESSRRYVTSEPEFYCPSEWRGAPDNKKQGSSGRLDAGPEMALQEMLERRQLQGVLDYEEALKVGVCAEQARLFLPSYGLYLFWRWSASLQGVCHFLNQRLDEAAQVEIQTYAQAVYSLVSQEGVYPLSTVALTGKVSVDA